MNKRIFISHGDKGGVGKSMTATVLVERLLQDGHSVALVEGDPSQPDVGVRYAGDKRITLGALPLNRAGDADAAVGQLSYWLESEAGDQVVINLPAGASETLDALAPFLREVADALEYDIYVSYSLGKGDAPTAGLIKSLKSGLLSFINEDKRVVLYPAFQGKPEDFAWFSNKARKEFKVRESIMPAIANRNTLNKLLVTRGAIGELARGGADGWMIADKIGIKRWLGEAMVAVNPLFVEGESI